MMISGHSLEQLFAYFIQYSSISEKAKLAISEICTPISINKNKDLQPIGHTCKTIYFIKHGAARIYYYKNGNDITECFVFENRIIARVESLFTGKPSQKAIEIIENTELIAINAPLLFNLYDTYPDIERLFRRIFEAAYVDTVNRVESIQFHTAEERYTTLINESPNVLQRVPLKHIASFLGITQVSLSRIRATIK